MRNFFTEKEKVPPQPQPSTHEPPLPQAVPPVPDTPHQFEFLFDFSDGSDETDVTDNDSDLDVESSAGIGQIPEQSANSDRLPQVPALKRRKLDIGYRVARKKEQEQRAEDLQKAHDDIEKLIKSKKTKFIGGINGLQARRARAIQSHLSLVVCNKRKFVAASEIAAEANGFSRTWGSRQLRSWTRKCQQTRILPKSIKGGHAKVESLLDDPAVAAELRAYVRTNKWALNPDKLAVFAKNELIPEVADKYLREIIREEMPRGLKRYMELELFPRIHMKVGRGISISTARRWLRSEGFRYISHKKGLYFDGHDRPDVVEYRQNSFLPAMMEYAPRLVRYVVNDVEKELDTKPQNYVEKRLVVCAQDESTAQSNDGKAKSWVFEDHHPLRKKGAGRGIHQSDVICSTVGWLEKGSQTIEYGKNYDGYWTGELFVKQVIVNICIMKRGLKRFMPAS